MKNLITKSALILLLGAGLVACDQKKNDTAQDTTVDAAASTSAAAPAETPAPAETGTTTPPTALAAIQFDATEYNFGKVKEGQKVSHTFNFTNTGNAPLVISNVSPSCGCTAADFTKTPVNPGEKGKITLQFDSEGRAGHADKSATVTANIEGGSTQLRITGDVEAKLTGGAPVNH